MGGPAPHQGVNFVLAAVAGVALCALVVVGAAANPLRAPRHHGLSTAGAIGDVVVIAGLIAAVAGVAVIIAAAILFEPGPRTALPSRRRRLLAPILLAILLALAFGAIVRRSAADGRAPATPAPLGPAAAPSPPPHSHVWRDTGWVLVAVLGLAALSATVVLRRQPHRNAARAEAPPDNAEVPAVVAGAVDAALDALESAADPRQSIIAAYARMLEALEERGLARLPSETPRRHLSRCLAAAAVRPEPLSRLVQLFEEARFSSHSMTWEHRDEARRALGAIRGDLVAVSR